MTEDKKRKFYTSLHGLRGFAAFMVFFGHSAGGFNEHYRNNESVILELINNIGTFGVELFFVLSGFVITNSIKKYDWKSFVRHRFWRIYPVFLTFTLTYYFLNLIFTIDIEKTNFFNLLYNLLQVNLFLGTPSLTPNAWSITYEIWFYVMAFCLIKSLLGEGNRLLLTVSIVASLAFAVRYPISFYFIGGILINYFISTYREQYDGIHSNIIRALELFILLSIVLLSAQQDYLYKWRFILDDWHIIALYLSTMLFITILLHPASLASKFLNNKSLLFLGTISYSLYLAHPYPYIAVRKLMEYTGIVEIPLPYSFIIYFFGAAIIAVPFSYVIYKYIEINIYRWATGRTIYSTSAS